MKRQKIQRVKKTTTTMIRKSPPLFSIAMAESTGVNSVPSAKSLAANTRSGANTRRATATDRDHRKRWCLF